MPRKATPTPPTIRRAMRQIGRHLAAWRHLQGLTEEQLADRAGLARLTVRRIEAGEGVAFENVLRVARSLGVLAQVVDALDPLATDLGRARTREAIDPRARRRSEPRP